MQLDLVPIQAAQSTPISNTGNVKLDLQPLTSSEIPANSTAGKIAQAASKIPGISTIANNPTVQTVANKVNAFSSGAVSGALNAVGDMGTLAANILSSVTGKDLSNLKQSAGAAYQHVKDYANNDNIGTLTRQENPITAAIGQGTGYIGANAAMAGGLVGAAKTGLTTLGMASPFAGTGLTGAVLNNVAEQGALGSVMGASSNPDNALHGASSGALAGMVLGGIGGYIGGRVKQAGNIIEREQGIAEAANIPTNSPAVINKIKSELDAKGVNLLKDDTRAIVNQTITDKINAIRPEGAINESPTATILRLGSQRYNEVKPISDANYQPLMTAPGTAQASNVMNTIQQVEKQLPSLGLPKKALPDQSTLSDLITYKRSLSNIQNAAFKQVRMGNLSMDDAKVYSTLNDAIDKDIATLADNQGLTNQLQKANQYWAQNILPFQAFNKGGVIKDPEQAATAFKLIGTQLKAKGVVDVARMQDLAKALGPDGQRTVGYGMIESSYKQSFNNQGEFDPGKFVGFMRKLTSTGVANKLMTPEHLSVMQGLNKTAAASTKILQQAAPKLMPGMLGAVQQKILEVAHSEMGINLLRLIGGSGTKTTAARDLMQKLVTGTYIHLKSEETNPNLNP